MLFEAEIDGCVEYIQSRSKHTSGMTSQTQCITPAAYTQTERRERRQHSRLQKTWTKCMTGRRYFFIIQNIKDTSDSKSETETDSPESHNTKQ